MNEKKIVSIAQIESSIYLIRKHRVMLDEDLARIYGVSTKRLNEQVRRNLNRFPSDFMFQLTYQEVTLLRSQFATSKEGKGGRRYYPYVFTEHGAIMIANILNSETAVEASVQVVRAFIRLREFLISHADLARKITEMEDKYDGQFKVVFDAIRKMMIPSIPEKRRIGFLTKV